MQLVFPISKPFEFERFKIRGSVVADGHTTADRPIIPARQVIQYFNWLWSEMTPTEGGIIQ